MAKLTEKQRIYQQYNGRCGYCGNPLGFRWVVATDPVVLTCCYGCAKDKKETPIEVWRQQLENLVAEMSLTCNTYKHALRYKQVKPVVKPIVFYYETLTAT